MAKPKGLIKRGNKWYIRVRIPKEIVDLYQTKQPQIMYSLDTEDLKEAISKFHGERASIEADFQEKRAKLKYPGNPDMLSDYSDDEMKQVAASWLWNKKKEIEEANINVKAGSLQTTDFIAELEEDAEYTRDEVHGLSYRQGIHMGRTIAARVLTDTKVTFDRQSEAFQLLGGYFSKAAYELSISRLRYFQGQLHLPTDPMFSPENIRQETHINLGSRGKITFHELCQKYMDDPKNSIGTSTQKNYVILKRAVSEVLGENKHVHEITRDDFEKLTELFSGLPTNAAKRGGGKPLMDVVEMAKKNGWPLIKAGTVNTHISKLTALLNYAEREDYIRKNLGKKLAVKDPVKKKKKRDPFSEEQLNTLFHTDVFLSDERNSRFWIPLIALWTGMRQSEICQLEPDDVQCKNGVYYFSVNEGEEGDEVKHLKTEASVRDIPVHPELKKMGFIEYVEKIKQQNADRLFPDLTVSVKGSYSANFSKWFGRFLKINKIKTPKTCFHSFRHSYRDALREADLPRNVELQLGGWSSNATADDYGDGLKIKTLDKHMHKVAYEGLDLSHLYV